MLRHLIVLVLLAALSAALCQRNVTGPVGTASLTTQQAYDLLEAHNTARQDVVPAAASMLLLRWDSRLAAAAQRSIESCPSQHIMSAADRRNVAGFSQVGQNFAVVSHDDPVVRAIAEWEADGRSFFYQRSCSSTTEVCGSCSTCGPYTQMIWANTHNVGCARQLCRNNVVWFVTCLYGETGNVPGQAPYRDGTPPQGCQLDAPATDDGDGKKKWEVPTFAAGGALVVLGTVGFIFMYCCDGETSLHGSRRRAKEGAEEGATHVAGGSELRGAYAEFNDSTASVNGSRATSTV